MNFFQIKTTKKMERTVNEDFKKLISNIKFFYSINQSDIAFNIGVKSTYLSDMINGRVPVTDSLLEKIYETYSDITPKSSDSLTKNNSLLIPKDGARKPVPYYNVDFAGGWSVDEMFSNSQPDFYLNNPEFDRSDFACNLRGKSVSKIIPDGAVVGFKIIDDWQTYFPQNELYGIITKNDFRTVKLIAKSKDGESLILKPQPSDQFHERYKDQEEIIPIEFVTKFLQVVAYARYERLVI
ncbi:TPA: helix-turn-helix domain-containing protein [Elizabethkingia anophelis]